MTSLGRRETSERPTRPRVLVPLSAVWAIWTIGSGVAAGQTTTRLEFEVASIRPTAVDPSRAAEMSRAGKLKYGPQIHGDRAEYIYVTLKHLVVEAYQIQGYQVNCPDWFTKDYYDIFAAMRPGSTKEDSRLMLQSLLADRFKLAVHWEPREEPVAELVVGKDGPKLKESTADQQPGDATASKRKAPTKDTNSIYGMHGSAAIRFNVDAPNSMVRMEGSNMAMRDLARILTVSDLGNGRPIVDRTGLKGNYDISLDIPMSMIGGPPAEDGAGHPLDTVSDPPEGARMMQSLKSLGLELKKTKALVDHLVVDHAERKPTEN